MSTNAIQQAYARLLMQQAQKIPALRSVDDTGSNANSNAVSGQSMPTLQAPASGYTQDVKIDPAMVQQALAQSQPHQTPNPQPQQQTQPAPQSVFATPFTPPRPQSVAVPNPPQEIPINHEDFKAMILPYLQSNDPAVQEYGQQLYNQWISNRMANQSKLEQQQQQSQLQSQQQQQQLAQQEQLANYNSQLRQSEMAHQLQMQQAMLPEQIQMQAALYPLQQQLQNSKDYNKSLVAQGSKDIADTTAQAQSAQSELGLLDQMDQLNQQLGQNDSPIMRYAREIMPHAFLSAEAQQMRALGDKMSLMSKPVGISRLTNMDVQLLKESNPNIGNDPQANQNLIDARRFADYDTIDYNNFLQDYVHANNGSSYGAHKIFEQFSKDNPLFLVQNGKLLANPNRMRFSQWLQQGGAKGQDAIDLTKDQQSAQTAQNILGGQ